MRNFTIIVPTELNMLVFFNNLYEQKAFPKVDIPLKVFSRDFRNIMIKIWDEKLTNMFVGNKYVHDPEYYKENLFELFDENTNYLDYYEQIISSFESWWFNQSPRGNQYLLEFIFHGSINCYEIEHKISLEEGNQILILFDQMPTGCQSSVREKKVIIKPIEIFLN